LLYLSLTLGIPAFLFAFLPVPYPAATQPKPATEEEIAKGKYILETKIAIALKMQSRYLFLSYHGIFFGVVPAQIQTQDFVLLTLLNHGKMRWVACSQVLRRVVYIIFNLPTAFVYIVHSFLLLIM